MDIVILAHFCLDFTEKDNSRFSYIANMLANDNNVEVITSDFYHITKQKRCDIPKLPYKVTLLHEPSYPRNVCLKRFYSHYLWGVNVEKYLNQRKKPDVIYCAVPSITGPSKAAKYCKDNKIRFVIDVQDLWPEAFQMVLNIPLISKLLFYPFKASVNKIYASADDICAVSDTYLNRALSVNRKCDKGQTVFLGTNLADFDSYAHQPPILNKKESEIWAAYCGTLGSSYDLTCVIDALQILKNNDISVKLIVMGDGPKKEEFQKYAISKDVDAVFTGRLRYDQMCSLLCICDITINPIMRGAAQSIINKHADYAACGLPVVSSQENDEYRKLVEYYNMGFNCKNGSAADMAEKIAYLAQDETLRNNMGKNSRRCAQEKFDRKVTYMAIVDAILNK